jgi:hypothetical protein
MKGGNVKICHFLFFSCARESENEMFQQVAVRKKMSEKQIKVNYCNVETEL